MSRDPPAEHDHSKTGTGGEAISPKKLRGADLENANNDDVVTAAGDGTMDMRPRKGPPSGAIVMWSGAISDIPDGWTLCDGTDGTPDLQNRFIVGAGDQYTVDETGGEKEHQLTESELPSHNHGANSTSSTNNFNISGGDILGTGSAEDTGNDEPHENRPPFYSLAYIQKI